METESCSNQKSNSNPKKITPKEDQKLDYIIKSDKPLIFRKKKAKKVTDLINTSNSGNNEEEEWTFENKDLSEEFFEKYFAIAQGGYDKYKSKNNYKEFNTNSQDENYITKQNSVVTNEKTKNETIVSSDKKKENNIIDSIENKKKNNKKSNDTNNFTYSIYQKVLEEERLEKLKKKKHFLNYISTVYIIQCRLETLEDIHKGLEALLPDVKINVSVPKSLTNEGFYKIYFIQKLDLSENNITFIHKDITLIPNLKILNLANNLIIDLNKIKQLQNIKKLMSLTLRGNKICMIRGYRQFVIELCPVLIQLDSAVVSEKELEIIHFKGSRYGEKRENGHGKIISYPNPFKYMSKSTKKKK